MNQGVLKVDLFVAARDCCRAMISVLQTKNEILRYAQDDIRGRFLIGITTLRTP